MSTATARVVCAAGLIVLATAGPAYAHATFETATAKADTVTSLTLKVPGEEAPAYTTKVTVEVLAGFTETSCTPQAAWTCDVTANTEQGRSALVVWTRKGTGVSGTDRFAMSVRTPNANGSFRFETTQEYSNGEKAFWADEPGADHPAPVLTVSGAVPVPSPSAVATTPQAEKPSPVPSAGKTDSDEPAVPGIVFVLSGVALLAGLGFYVVKR